MKKTFMKFLPVAAAVLLATSCSKDDNGSTVVDNIATPDPVQEVVKPVAKTITITGKVNQNLSKVTTGQYLKLLFEGTEVFTIFDGAGNEYGKFNILTGGTTYEAVFDADKIKEGDFTAKLGEEPTTSLAKGYQTLQDALDALYCEIPFSVKKGADDSYSIGAVTAVTPCAFIKALSSKTIKLGAVTAGNYYIIPEAVEFNEGKKATARVIYNVGGKDALSGTFTVADGKTVSFSKGNLMYRPGFGFFFADNQLAYIGDAEGNTSETEGTRDLFGWGTWLKGGSPMNSSQDPDYYTWGSDDAAIGYGWKTLSIADWDNLLNNTSRADTRFVKSIVNGKKGLIIFPDGYNKTVTGANTNGDFEDVSTSWSDMESEGAVFLPDAGRREKNSVTKVGEAGSYWSSTVGSSSDRGSYLYLDLVYQTSGMKYLGYSVRLVK